MGKGGTRAPPKTFQVRISGYNGPSFSWRLSSFDLGFCPPAPGVLAPREVTVNSPLKHGAWNKGASTARDQMQPSNRRRSRSLVSRLRAGLAAGTLLLPPPISRKATGRAAPSGGKLGEAAPRQRRVPRAPLDSPAWRASVETRGSGAARAVWRALPGHRTPQARPAPQYGAAPSHSLVPGDWLPGPLRPLASGCGQSDAFTFLLFAQPMARRALWEFPAEDSRSRAGAARPLPAVSGTAAGGARRRRAGRRAATP